VPHVVLEGPITIDVATRTFAPFVARDGDLVIKAERLYRERDSRAALVEMVVVEAGHTQKFFIQLSPRESGLTVRLEPLTDPEKTAGVRHAIARLAHALRSATGASYGRTNIEEYLIR
jgi:hypothetical protein